MESTKEGLREELELAHVLISEGQTQEAIQKLETLVREYSGSFEVYAVLCNLYISLEKVDIPKEWILNALKGDPSLRLPLIELATRLYEENRLKESSNILEALVWNDPDNYQAWNDLGAVFFAMNDHVTAEKAFNQSLALSPGYGEAIMNLTTLYMTTNRPEMAIQTAEMALEKDCDATTDLMREMAGIISQIAPQEASLLLDKAREVTV